MKGLGAVRTVVVAAAGVGLVWGAGQVDGGLDLAQASDAKSASAGVSPVSHTELVCPGADRPGVKGVADQEQLATILTASAPSKLLPKTPADDGSVTASTLPGDQSVPGTIVKRGATRPIRVDGPAGIDLTAKDGLAPGLAATQVGLERAASVKGLTMAPCAAPAPTSYLAAGGSKSGQSERLVLTNPAPNPVPVTVSVLGTADRQSVTVPSRSRKVVVLGSVNDTAKAPVVKVSAGRGTIGAALVESTFAGAVPRGTEVVGPTQQPGRTQIVSPVMASKGGDSGVRVGVPGSKDAIVRLSIVAPEGREAPDDVVRTVPGGSSTDIGLPNLPSGHYAVRVTSDEPVVAVGRSRLTKDGKKPGDMLWSPATAPLSGLGGTAVPKVPGGSASLVLAAPGASARTAAVSRTDADGTVHTERVTVPAGQTRSVALKSTAAVWVEPTTSKPVSASLLVTGKDGKQPLLSGVALPPVSVSARSTEAQVRPAN